MCWGGRPTLPTTPIYGLSFIQKSAFLPSAPWLAQNFGLPLRFVYKH